VSLVRRRPSLVRALERPNVQSRDADLAAAYRGYGPLERWHVVGTAGEPGFGAPWRNSTAISPAPQSIAFFKDHSGFVHLRGAAQAEPTAANNTSIFTLPSTYRPSAVVYEPTVATIDGGTFLMRTIRILTNGNVVVPTGGYYLWLLLDNKVFRASN
jgi:hypothetical protein